MLALVVTQSLSKHFCVVLSENRTRGQVIHTCDFLLDASLAVATDGDELNLQVLGAPIELSTQLAPLWEYV